ncbi:MAG: cupredoxin domain-containing protein [Gemmatimonadetes bacterium]|nr:cupredoxin domain-containing protein [Gemmatimonadota bacterium]
MKRIFIVAAVALFASSAGAQPVDVTLSEWKVLMSRDTVKAGSVTFRVTNNGTMSHTLYVIGNGIDQGTRDIVRRAVTTLTVTLKPGTYEVFCPMAENTHKMAGMTTMLVVTAADPAPAKKKPDTR